MTVPSLRAATLCIEPAATLIAFVNSAGGEPSPNWLLPHSTTFPSTSRARPCVPPAPPPLIEMAMAFVIGGGVAIEPHAITLPAGSAAYTEKQMVATIPAIRGINFESLMVPPKLEVIIDMILFLSYPPNPQDQVITIPLNESRLGSQRCVLHSHGVSQFHRRRRKRARN